MDIKMIVTDLDHTLLRHDKTVSNYTSWVFQCIRNCGILIAFATARDFRFVTEYIAPLTGIKPDVLIAANGALVRHDGIDVYRRMIPKNTINALMTRFKLVRSISTEYDYYILEEYSNNHWSTGKKATIITDFSKEIENDAFYLDGNINKPLPTLTECYPEIRTVAYSDVDLITIVHHEATKLNALNAVKSMLNIRTSDIAVFGDDYSDIEMLTGCHNSIAVANAIDECKAVANYLCGGCEEDGVAKWIEENVL